MIGDGEPCLPYSAMCRLRQPADVGEDHLPDVLREPRRVVDLLLTVEDLHDRAVLGGPESLDAWFVCLYRQVPNVIALAQVHEGRALAGTLLVSVVDRAAFDAVGDAAWRFFTERTDQPATGPEGRRGTQS